MSHLAHTVRRSPRRARLTAGIVLLMLAAFALVWIGRASADDGASSPEAVSTSVSNVATGRADALDATARTCTSSSPFVDMPSMSKAFKLGGRSNQPVLVLFQGRWGSEANSFAVIRLTIDGVVQPGAGAFLTVHEDDGGVIEGTNGFNFISAPLTPGTHTATIQWRSSSGEICVQGRSLIVLHK